MTRKLFRHIRATQSAIERLRKKQAEQIRTFVRSQKSLWQQVPWLALQADGQSGYSDIYSYAYHHGLWVINHQQDYSPFVDCATGEIVDYTLKPVESWRIPLVNDRCFDAHHIIAELRATIAIKRKRTRGLDGKTSKELEVWREEKAKQLSLGPVYRRRSK